IAFTGEYDGNADVFVMNIHGGDIRRVTFHPGADIVVGWHPVSNKIIFSSARNSFSRFQKLYLINVDGTGLEELILHEAVQGSFSPDGNKIAYNRVGREHRTWKRYQGGLAQDIYLFDFEKMKDSRLTDFKGTDRIPMWIGDKIYFSSDRDRVLNIWAYDTQSGQVEQITFHKEFDVRRPSASGNHIVYELGGSLWVLDVNSGETNQVMVEIRSELPELRPYWKNVDDLITGVDCSPEGNRALIVARGEVFTVPQKDGPTRNLTNACGSREKDAAWSPDGKKIAYLSDMSGEYEIYIIDPFGKSEAIRLTKHENGYRHTLRWSPDSKKIAFADQTLRCYYLNVDTKKITVVDRAEYENVDVSLDIKPIYDFVWSPDSRFLAYSKMNHELVSQVHIYALETGETHCISQGIFNDFQPAFSADGNYLFFISNRRFDPTLCDFEWEMVYKKVAGIYCLTLQKDTPSLLPFYSDEVEIKPTVSEKAKPKKSNDKTPAKLQIDFEGIAERIEALPLPRGNYRYLSANENSLFYLNKDEGDFNRFEFRSIGAMDLYAFSLKDQKENSVIKGIDSYKLSADGSKIVYKKGKSVGIIDASATDSKGNELNLSDVKILLEPLKEWTQIFHEAWRMERDFYYESGMHGIDWVAMKEKYQRLLPYISCRQDLRYLIGELIGELNTSHTYVFGGDVQRKADRVNVGLLGVDWHVDTEARRYQFKKIYRVADWTSQLFPPLSKPGVDVREGDYLLTVNGVDVTADHNVFSYFENLAGKQITILVNDKPIKSGAREYTVKPIGNEYSLRYQDWMENNRLLVEKKSSGKIGYLHLPDTYLGSAREFPKYFYSQTRKKGLIIDGRFNGGGLDPDIFLRRLDKKTLAYWTRRYSHDQTIPDLAVRAHMVCITNRQAGSGGDMLPLEFRKKGLGPVIGTRSWGGLVGVSCWISLIDGGGMSAPDYRIYDTDGQWIVENEGVSPDVEIDLDPVEVSRGYDAQLEEAIKILMKKNQTDPLVWPEHLPFPKDQ
ncbi:MAG TPA: peptidase S41, partial [bacterium]|nr:peptidase S41 [bacterium]